MKKKLYIVLSILTLVFFLTTSAICTQCAVEGEAPTIELEIYDGPEYSESDNMCYYRVEAIATGTPEPEIEFDEDDNINPLGTDKVEVAVDMGESYSLTATATNDLGTSSASIALSGECSEEVVEEDTEEETEEEETTEEGTEEEVEEEVAEEEVAEEEVTEEETDDDLDVDADADTDADGDGDAEPEPEEEEAAISATPYISGYIFYGYGEYTIRSTDFVRIGDTNIDTQMKGYLSFDISGLHGKTVQDASIDFEYIQRENHPEDFASAIVVKVYNYVRLDRTDFTRVGGVHLVDIPILDTSYTISGDTLINELQDVLDNEVRDYFQLKLFLDGEGSDNERLDNNWINCDDAILTINYTD